MVLREKDTRHKFSAESYIGYPVLRQNAVPLAVNKNGKNFVGLVIKAFRLDPYIASQFIFVNPNIIYKKHWNEKGPMIASEMVHEDPLDESSPLILKRPLLNIIHKKNRKDKGLFYGSDVLFNDKIVNDVYPNMFGKVKENANPLEMTKGQKMLLENGGWITKPFITYNQLQKNDISGKYIDITKKTQFTVSKSNSFKSIKTSFTSIDDKKKWIKSKKTLNPHDPLYVAKEPLSSMDQVNLCKYGTTQRTDIRNAYFKDFRRITGYGLDIHLPSHIKNKISTLENNLKIAKESEKYNISEELNNTIEIANTFILDERVKSKNIFNAFNNILNLNKNSYNHNIKILNEIDTLKKKSPSDAFEEREISDKIVKLENSLDYDVGIILGNKDNIEKSFTLIEDILTKKGIPEEESLRSIAVSKLYKINKQKLTIDESVKSVDTKFGILSTDNDDIKREKIINFVKSFNTDFKDATITRRTNACKIITVLNSYQNHKGWHTRVTPNRIYGDKSHQGINDPKSIDQFLNSTEESLTKSSVPDQIKLVLSNLKDNSDLLNICDSDDPTSCLHPDEIQNLGLYSLKKKRIDGGYKEYSQSSQYQFPDGMSIFTFLDVPNVYYRLTNDMTDRYNVFNDFQSKIRDASKDFVDIPDMNIKSIKDVKRVGKALQLELLDEKEETIPFMPLKNNYNSSSYKKNFKDINKEAKSDITTSASYSTTSVSFPKVKSKWNEMNIIRKKDIAELNRLVEIAETFESKSEKEKEDLWREITYSDSSTPLPSNITEELSNQLKMRLTIKKDQYYGADTSRHYDPKPIIDTTTGDIVKFDWKENRGCFKGTFDVGKNISLRPNTLLLDGNGEIIRYQKIDKHGKTINLSIPEIKKELLVKYHDDPDKADPQNWKWTCIAGEKEHDKEYFEKEYNVPYGIQYVNQRRAVNIYKNSYPKSLNTIDEGLVKDSVSNALQDIAKTAYNAIQLGSIASLPEFISNGKTEMTDPTSVQNYVKNKTIIDTLVNPNRFKFESIQELPDPSNPTSDVNNRNAAFGTLLKKVNENQKLVGTEEQWAIIHSLIKDGNPEDYKKYLGKDNRLTTININSIWLDPSQNSLVRRRKAIRKNKFGLPNKIATNPFDPYITDEDKNIAMKKIDDIWTNALDGNKKESDLSSQELANVHKKISSIGELIAGRQYQKSKSVIALDTNLLDIFKDITQNQITPTSIKCDVDKIFNKNSGKCE